ncbi:MAG: hypothetical protein ACP5TY_09215 [Thermodesulforhabdaceae bacterium]
MTTSWALNTDNTVVAAFVVANYLWWRITAIAWVSLSTAPKDVIPRLLRSVIIRHRHTVTPLYRLLGTKLIVGYDVTFLRNYD